MRTCTLTCRCWTRPAGTTGCTGTQLQQRQRGADDEPHGATARTPRSAGKQRAAGGAAPDLGQPARHHQSEEHTSELQSRPHLVCRLLLEKKKQKKQTVTINK